MYKRSLILFTFSTGILCNIVTDDIPELNVRGSRSLNDSVTNNIPGYTRLGSVSCQNNYNAERQSFYINGRHMSPSSSSTREGYILTRGVGAHRLYRRRLTWNAAREACMRDGGYLAILNSLAEESVLLRVLEQANVVEAWIGIHDQFQEGDWVTLTGESLEEAGFDKWTTAWPDEPDNLGGHQNCGVIVKVGGIDDVVCDLHHMYICEVDID